MRIRNGPMTSWCRKLRHGPVFDKATGAMVGTPGSSEPSGMVKCLPSGKRLQFAIENGHKNSGFTHWKLWLSIVCESLPEGNAWGLDPIILLPS